MMPYDILFRGGYRVVVKAESLSEAIHRANQSAIDMAYSNPVPFKVVFDNGTTVFYCGVMEEFDAEEYQCNDAIPDGVCS